MTPTVLTSPRSIIFTDDLSDVYLIRVTQVCRYPYNQRTALTLAVPIVAEHKRQPYPSLDLINTKISPVIFMVLAVRDIRSTITISTSSVWYGFIQVLELFATLPDEVRSDMLEVSMILLCLSYRSGLYGLPIGAPWKLYISSTSILSSLTP